MPELPEVETVVRQLSPHVANQQLKKLVLHDSKLKGRNLQQAWPSRIQKVFRSGKQIVFELRPTKSQKTLYLAVHLRMTGRLIVGEAVATLPHLRALFELEKTSIAFTDVRRFGTISLHKNPSELMPVGIDPFDSSFTKDKLAEMIGTSAQEIKVWLLRQDRIVGIGNIYASEILFDARILPDRPAGTLTPKEISKLHGSTIKILRKAIDACGTTFSDFQTAQGQEGSFGKFLKVYGKEKQPCKRCRAAVTICAIEKIVQGQRSTFFCPSCQK